MVTGQKSHFIPSEKQNNFLQQQSSAFPMEQSTGHAVSTSVSSWLSGSLQQLSFSPLTYERWLVWTALINCLQDFKIKQLLMILMQFQLLLNVWTVLWRCRLPHWEFKPIDDSLDFPSCLPRPLRGCLQISMDLQTTLKKSAVINRTVCLKQEHNITSQDCYRACCSSTSFQAVPTYSGSKFES